MDTRIDMLSKELESWEERLRILAMRMEELASVDCPLGECILDPEMQAVQAGLSDAQRHKEMVEHFLKIERKYGVA